MVSQKLKDMYWATIGRASLVNLYYRRLLSRLWSHDSLLLLNLGSGKRYIKGFINIDGNISARKDLWLDIRHGLPYANNSVRAIYLCHVLEHVSWKEAQRVLRECHRVLVAGGGIRAVTPSMEKAIEAYLRGDGDWFPSWPDVFKSIGGRFNNYLLCRDQHRLMFDFSLMEEVLASAGFCSVEKHGYGSSRVFSAALLAEMEPEGSRDFYERSLVAEGSKRT